MGKHLIVEVNAKARKKARVNDKGHARVSVPQLSHSTLNGSEATTKPTDRRRQ